MGTETDEAEAHGLALGRCRELSGSSYRSHLFLEEVPQRKHDLRIDSAFAPRVTDNRLHATHLATHLIPAIHACFLFLPQTKGMYMLA